MSCSAASQVEMPLSYLLSSMEIYGVGFHKQAVAPIITQIEQKKDWLAKEIHNQAGCEFNVNMVSYIHLIYVPDVVTPYSRKFPLYL